MGEPIHETIRRKVIKNESCEIFYLLENCFGDEVDGAAWGKVAIITEKALCALLMKVQTALADPYMVDIDTVNRLKVEVNDAAL